MKTCLVIDDSPIIRAMCRFMLQRLNFNVSEAEDGLIAQKMVKAECPDLIILDWSMPNMDGISFIRWLRQEMQHQDQPCVIFCTSHNKMDSIERALAAGANEYIMKPFDSHIIAHKLETLGLL
jgi:two-component system, chemotaxis family, chemotaxis protein CheY